MIKQFGINKVCLADIGGWENYKKYRWAIHIAVWLSYTVLYYLYTMIYNPTALGRTLTQFALISWTDILAVYISVYYFIPQFLLKKKYLSFFIYFITLAFAFVFIQRSIQVYVVYPEYYPDRVDTIEFFKFSYLYYFFSIYVMTFIFASVKLFEYWFVNQKQNQESQKQKMESELKLLKSQIHPHFLFNTLNNLYALTLDKSDAAPEVVVKLSELMNYMLYECNVPLISLEKEVKYLNNYLDLEKIRYQKDLKTNIEITGNITGKHLPPLLLLPFVENAFKHGLSKNIDNPWIQIKLKVIENGLCFEVKNNKPIRIQEDLSGYTEGIGLKNVKRRLELIYGDSFNLEISEKTQSFAIKLDLTLSASSTKAILQ